MKNIEINEKMVAEIKELLLKYDLFHGTTIYYNDRCMYDTKEGIVEKEGVNVEDYLTYFNADMVTLSYEGVNSLFLMVNGYAYEEEHKEKAKVVVDELYKIGEKYNRYYEIGDDKSLFYVSDTDNEFSRDLAKWLEEK